MKSKYAIALLLSGWMVMGTLCPQLAAQAEDAPPPVVSQSPEQLQQLVAPIALYPDELVAQILASATYPPEVVEADRWLQEHSNVKGKELAGRDQLLHGGAASEAERPGGGRRAA